MDKYEERAGQPETQTRKEQAFIMHQQWSRREIFVSAVVSDVLRPGPQFSTLNIKRVHSVSGQKKRENEKSRPVAIKLLKFNEMITIMNSVRKTEGKTTKWI